MAGYLEPKLLPMGDTAWTIELGDAIDIDVNARCMGLAAAVHAEVDAGTLSGVRDVVPTFRSVTVHFDPRLAVGAHLGTRLLALARDVSAPATAKRSWRLPACFDARLAPDLPVVAAQTGLSETAVIAQFLSTSLRVYAMGFMPGFAYMASIPEVLACPRLSTPRTQVPPKSLAIAGRMAAIYPWVSPGGWNLIGAVPLPTFDLSHSAAPALFEAGDVVSFYAIDWEEYAHLERPVADPVAFRAQFLSGLPE